LVLGIDLGGCVPGVAWAWTLLAIVQPYGSGATSATRQYAMGLAVLAATLLANCTRRIYSALRTVPSDLLDSAIALGATRWSALTYVGYRSAYGWLGRAALRCVTRAMAESVALLAVLGSSGVAITPLGVKIAQLGLHAETSALLQALMLPALVLTLATYAIRRSERDPRHAADSEQASGSELPRTATADEPAVIA
jgi:ABC-type phosphate transport system permease subunit